jgi:nucleoid-associated protein YgaU
MTQLSADDAPRLLPQEYWSLVTVFEQGERNFQQGEPDADDFYLFALQKGTLLHASLLHLKEQKAQEDKKRAAELAVRAEEERILREVIEAERRQAEQERLKREEARKSRAAKEAGEQKENSSPDTYTVLRGETLPQIAARAEIYNTASLWPLIYRANRDQIRDPKQLWPGQILKIPRHFSREEALEAKRYSGKK